MNDLILAYEEYIELLLECIGDSEALAYIHGVQTTQEKIDLAEKLRERIKILKADL